MGVRSRATKKPAPRNRSLRLERGEIRSLQNELIPSAELRPSRTDCIVSGRFEEALPGIADASVDLLFLDPPYNLDKRFGEFDFKGRSPGAYTDYLESLLLLLVPKLKPTATVYLCGDWKSSLSIPLACSRFLTIRNRITWEREKGRGATFNWKNCSEDIWFCTVSNSYTFHPERVKLRRKVRAPYRDPDGRPKDWQEGDQGRTRDTAPSNLWTDITIPFWSMPENTEHPTQKSEKLLAKLLLASSEKGDLVLDPFLGSGTTAVVCKKLGRRFIGIERDRRYCALALKRLKLAEPGGPIQGFENGVFLDRNSG